MPKSVDDMTYQEAWSLLRDIPKVSPLYILKELACGYLIKDYESGKEFEDDKDDLERIREEAELIGIEPPER